MPSPRGRNSTTLRRSLRERTRERFRKMRDENRSKAYRSVAPAYYAFREFRETARQTLSCVKSAVENISNRCLHGRSRLRGPESAYAPVGSPTPVKLYTPFGIETPSPVKSSGGAPTRKREKSPRKTVVGTPARKLREDLREVSTGIAELSAVADRIARR